LAAIFEAKLKTAMWVLITGVIVSVYLEFIATYIIPGTRLEFVCPTGLPPPNHFLVA
jgi:uncharacterized membrane protein (DUF106 family)